MILNVFLLCFPNNPKTPLVIPDVWVRIKTVLLTCMIIKINKVIHWFCGIPLSPQHWLTLHIPIERRADFNQPLLKKGQKCFFFCIVGFTWHWSFFLNKIKKIQKKNLLCDRTVPVFVWMWAGIYSDAASWLLYNSKNGTVSLSAWMWKERLGFAQSHSESLVRKTAQTQVESWPRCGKPACPLSDGWEGSSTFEGLILFVSLRKLF